LRARQPTTYWFENERLHRAAADGDVEEMRRLLAAGYKLDLFDDLGRTPLHYAVEGEHYKAAEWLIRQGASVNAHDEATVGETPLALAVQRDYPEMVELLLMSGADPDITGWMANTARSRAERGKDEDGRKIASLIQKHRPR
jgi:ankyrin repeat protein